MAPSLECDDSKGHSRFFVPTQFQNRVLGPLYTHIDTLKHYGWKVFAHQPVSEPKRQLTRRQVGGGVYVADDYLGSAEELGEPGLKPMLAMGMPVVYVEIEEAFGKAT